MKEYPCPICGKPTTGTVTEWGNTWDVCPDCFENMKNDKEPSPDKRAVDTMK
jgi:ribosome-binding protein aMBF1 (putative translation factor)